jgi:uncharacterized membrane protein YdjX (TVP38/TMEM64 family)
MIKKVILFALYIGAAYMIYAYKESIMAWFNEVQHVGWVMLGATVMALFPVIPYPIVGALIGAAYGPALGGLLTWTGSTAASLLMFLFVRYGYQDWGLNILHMYKPMGRVTLLFERNAFLAVLFGRMLPMIPSIVINVYAALSRISFAQYAIASSVGKIPAMLLFVLVGDSLMTDPRNIVLTIGIYAVFLAGTLTLYRLWLQRSGRSSL